VTTDRSLPCEDPVAQELTLVIKGGDSERLGAMLGSDPGLATCLVMEDGGGRTPLHLLADAPGGRPRCRDTVSLLAAAGADLNAPAVGMWHVEAPLHWAASNDDVDLIDALLDAGADIECPGSSIGDGLPIQSAIGYGQWHAVRRLHERGAQTPLSGLAILGLTEEVEEALGREGLDRDAMSVALWNACRVGDIVIARLLVDAGADPAWPSPWSGETPLDIARSAGQEHLIPWLASRLAS
jgi:ankyrin repeat protein